MRHALKSAKVKFYIGDVRDSQSLDVAMQGVDFVFHAAALKQVPSCEFYPLEAVKTNVFGTENVLTTAIKHQVKKVICLSKSQFVGHKKAPSNDGAFLLCSLFFLTET